MHDDRRRMLKWLAAMPFAGFAAARAVAAPAPAAACYDPSSLPMAQKSLRKSLEFLDVSADGNKRCGLCAFYQAKGDCGTCQILSSVVSPGSTCSSFAAKAG